jgi:hypothetical protein
MAAFTFKLFFEAVYSRAACVSLYMFSGTRVTPVEGSTIMTHSSWLLFFIKSRFITRRVNSFSMLCAVVTFFWALTLWAFSSPFSIKSRSFCGREEGKMHGGGGGDVKGEGTLL